LKIVDQENSVSSSEHCHESQDCVLRYLLMVRKCGSEKISAWVINLKPRRKR